jgi:hypothetical protein
MRDLALVARAQVVRALFTLPLQFAGVMRPGRSATCCSWSRPGGCIEDHALFRAAGGHAFFETPRHHGLRRDPDRAFATSFDGPRDRFGGSLDHD